MGKSSLLGLDCIIAKPQRTPATHLTGNPIYGALAPEQASVGLGIIPDTFVDKRSYSVNLILDYRLTCSLPSLTDEYHSPPEKDPEPHNQFMPF